MSPHAGRGRRKVIAVIGAGQCDPEEAPVDTPEAAVDAAFARYEG